MPDRKIRDLIANPGIGGGVEARHRVRPSPTRPGRSPDVPGRSSDDTLRRLSLFVVIVSGILLLACVGSLLAKAVGMSRSTLFGEWTSEVAIATGGVWAAALWVHGHRSDEQLRRPGRAGSKSPPAEAERLPLWLALFTKVVHYPAMCAIIAGVALLLGDSSWIEKHTHSEPIATKLAGLAVIATSVYALAAARKLNPHEESEDEQNDRWKLSRKKHA